MSEGLTQQQRAAVENRGRSLLVSAAAGSGKTKVLVERLFSYVERDGADLDDFLIITYTRAAASELRGKIARALSERLENDPTNARLQRQMLRVYRADIKTVDAFCTSLLRENCHLLSEDEHGHTLRPDFRVLDESDAELLRRRTLSRVLDRFYDSLTDGDGGTLAATTAGFPSWCGSFIRSFRRSRMRKSGLPDSVRDGKSCRSMWRTRPTAESCLTRWGARRGTGRGFCKTRRSRCNAMMR